jgi:hypothetical protein
MTAWFLSNDNDERNRRITTAEVEHTQLNLPRGRFTGIVFDWSPAEYANQEFVGMTRPDCALVKVRPATVQPVADDELYGPTAVPDNMPVPVVESTGMHQLCVTPDPMCADTLQNVEVITGAEGDLVLWKDRDEYGKSLVYQTFYCQPKPIIWDLRVMIHVKGAQYLHSVQATVAGLAEGTWLADLRHTSTACLHPLEEWRTYALSDDVSVLATSIHTFGLPESDSATRAGNGATKYSPLRLNLRVLLRDEETVLYYHFDVSPEDMTIFEEQRVVRVEIPAGMDLPYADAKGSAGFDATVTPWEPGGNAEVDM